MAASTSVFEVACCAPMLFVDDGEESNSETASTMISLDESIRQERREQQEVTAWTLDSIARGVIVMGAAVFVSTALLKLAYEAAGCETEPQHDDTYQVPECNEKVFGMRPTSLLTNIVMISGLASAALMPLVGSYIDHTNHRRTVGRISAACLVLFILLQIIALRYAWFIAAAIQVVVAFLYSVHLCATYAYLPELTTNGDTLVTYTSRFTAAQYGASVAFLLIMVGLLNMTGISDEVVAAQMSQASVLLVISVFFGVAWWRLFQERGASHHIPEGTTLLNAGFVKLFRTAREIVTYHKSLKWFLVSAALTQSATTSFSSIAITYMTDQLHFGSTENAISILLLLVFAVPGARLAQTLATWINPVQSLKLCLLLWMSATATASFVLHGKDQEVAAYVFAVFWGICIGWVYPTEKALYCSIIPQGQAAELMGFYIFACQVLSWLPPFVFSAMNEAGFSMRAGLFSLNGYFFVSFTVLNTFFGNYSDAVQHAMTFNGEGGKQQEVQSPSAATSAKYEAPTRIPSSSSSSSSSGNIVPIT